jgi:hypothetical protein
VQFADRYFFNRRGKTRYVTFDGPYENDKTPTAETKKLEREILATFSLIPKPRTPAKRAPAKTPLALREAVEDATFTFPKRPAG